MALPVVAVSQLAAIGQTMGKIGALGDVFTTITGKMGALGDVFTKITDKARGFVDAYNPQAGLNLDRAFRSLQATIGFALEPVIMGAARIIDNFAGALVSGMDRLRGPIEAVVGMFSGALKPAIAAVEVVMDGLADAAEALLPLFDVLGTAIEGVATLFRLLVTIGVTNYLDALKSIIPGAEDIKDVTNTLKEAFVFLFEVVLRYTEFMLTLLNKAELFRPILESFLKPGPAATGRQGAPTGFAIGGLEDIYRRRLLESARGGGQSTQEKTYGVMLELKKLAEKMLKEISEGELARLNQNLAEGFARGFGGQVAVPEGAALAGLGIEQGILQGLQAARQQQRNEPGD
jgi:hypothetical protein